jgi:hypothetical protein
MTGVKIAAAVAKPNSCVTFRIISIRPTDPKVPQFVVQQRPSTSCADSATTCILSKVFPRKMVIGAAVVVGSNEHIWNMRVAAPKAPVISGNACSAEP